MPSFSFESSWISGTRLYAPEHFRIWIAIKSAATIVNFQLYMQPAQPRILLFVVVYHTKSEIHGPNIDGAIEDAIVLVVAIRSTEIALRLSPLLILILTPAAILSASRETNANHPNNNNAFELAWNYTVLSIQQCNHY
jgi:hypothetical protein